MIKVSLISNSHSSGRGIGYYADNLSRAFEGSSDIKLVKTNPDLLHYPFFDLFYPTLPLYKSYPTVVTIHDLTPLRLPHLYPPGIKGTINLYRQWLSLQTVKAVITDSQNSKKDLIELFHVPTQKIFVTPLAANPIFSKPVSSTSIKAVKQKYHLPDKFILTVAGGPNPNKNLPLLAEATSKLNLPLVIVGKNMLQEVVSPVHTELKDLAILKKYSHIIYPGFVPTPELSAFYHLATLYCQPSLYEGFGLPVLEAMMSQCLLVSSHSSSLPEIYHSDTITFDPKSSTSLIESLTKALNLSPAEIKDQKKLQLKKSAEFTWKKTAAKTLLAYRSVL